MTSPNKKHIEKFEVEHSMIAHQGCTADRTHKQIGKIQKRIADIREEGAMEETNTY